MREQRRGISLRGVALPALLQRNWLISAFRHSFASTAKLVAMAVTFALSVPAGVFIGVGVTLHLEEESENSTMLWMLGAANGAAGGALLYMTFITFIGEDMMRADLNTAPLRSLKYQMWALLFLGAALMALIGIWA